MSIQSEIDRISQNIADTYSVAESAGATMPTAQNSDNLAATVVSALNSASISIFTTTAVLPVSGWIEDIDDSAQRWYQTVTVDGVLASDDPFIDIYLNGLTEEQEDTVAEGWACMAKITTSNNAITAYARWLPEVDIPIKIKEVRKHG